MPRSRSARCGLAAFLLLFVVDGLAAAPRSGDIPDTHRRLEDIYKRLGIKRVETRDEPEREGCRGCSCGRRRQESSEPTPRLSSFRLPAMPPFLGYLLLAAVIVAMLVPLYFSLRDSYRRSSQEREPELEEGQRESATAEVRGPWQVDLAECRRLLEAGKFPEAFAALHRAFLIGLAAQRHLILDTTTTNWEYVRRLSSRPQLRQTLAAVTVAAEASVLGQHPPPRDQYFILEEKVIAASRSASERVA